MRLSLITRRGMTPWVAHWSGRSGYRLEAQRRQPWRLTARIVGALQRALFDDLDRQHRELRDQVLSAYGGDAYYRDQAWTWNRWGW